MLEIVIEGKVIRKKWGEDVFNDPIPHEWKSPKQLREDIVSWLDESLTGLREVEIDESR